MVPRKISRARALKLLSHLCYMAEMLHEKEYDFEYIMTENEPKRDNFKQSSKNIPHR